MRTKLNLIPTHLLSSLFLISTLFSCGSYQTLSYYASDGIYGGEVAVRKTVEPKTNDNGVYYKNYFSNVADDYSSLDNPQNYAFTDTNNYSSYNGNGNVQVNSQAPWGDRTRKTEIYYINNNPWGYFNFNWGFYNSFYDPIWGYSPFFYSGFYRPNWGLSFYDPFFRFGYGFGYPFYAPRYGFRGYYGNRYDRKYAYSSYSRGSSRYANSSTSRGRRSGQGYFSSNNSRNNKYNTTDNFNSSSTNRYNVGRRTSQTSNGSNSKVTRNANTRSNQNSRYNNRSQSNSNYPSSKRSNYNSGRSYGSSRSSYSSIGRSSSYSSGSRGSSSGGRSSSRGR